jgi:two-component system, cell cycle sensor histidine kinase and response regulator CckA
MDRTGFEQWKPREVARLLALVETERRYYQEMVAALPVALAVLSPDRAIASANRAFRRLVNLTGDELRQKSIEQILPSDALIERIRSAHVHGDLDPFFVDTGERRFRMAAIPIRSWEDELQAETLLMVEPVDLERSEADRVESELVPPHAAAPVPDLSTLPGIVWQADASSFAFTYVSGAAEDLLGYPAAHWLAEPLFLSERIHPGDRAEVMGLYESVAATGGEASAEFRAINAAGESVWYRETIGAPAPGSAAAQSNASRRISGIMTAIGKRRQMEAQAIQAGRVDALRGLASRLAHDLNNPLMIVSGYSEELLNALPADAPARSDLAEILAAATRMTDLTASLLGFTRSQAMAPSKIALSEVVAGLEPRLRELVKEVGIAFPAGAVWTYADAEQLAEAITAIAAFAVENDARKITLTCHTGQVTERTGTAVLAPGLYARLEILAPGNASASPRAFESVLSGSAITRAYLNIRQWGGDIVYSIHPEYGSSFTVYLPYAEAPYVEPLPVEPLETAAATSGVKPQALPAVSSRIESSPVEPPYAEPEPEPSLGTILVVEDEPGIRGLVRKILRRENYDVLEAGSGEEALTEAAAQDVAIDLLLTDVMLPGIGGRELAESLAAGQPELKVVYVSGFTDDEGVRTGQFPPGSRFLQKPFTLSALVGIVKEALGH